MTEHIKTRRKIKEIPSITSFNALLDKSTLSPTDKRILKMHYLEDKNFAFIADELGYQEITVVTKHRAALKKLNHIL